MLTQTQIDLVQATWAQVTPIAAQAGALFYDRLFALDPELRPLFKGDVAQQAGKLMTMINTAVAGLDGLDRLVPAVMDLGRRHVGYGVRDAHYDTVGAALLWTLEQGLGDAFTAEVKDAWAAVYGVLADVMKQGAAQAA